MRAGEVLQLAIPSNGIGADLLDESGAEDLARNVDEAPRLLPVSPFFALAAKCLSKAQNRPSDENV